MVLFDLLQGVSIELETVELEAEDLGQLINPSGLLCVYFAMIRFVPRHFVVEGTLPRLEEVPLLLVLNIEHYVQELLLFRFFRVRVAEQVLEGQEVLRLSLERLLDFRLHRLY